MAHTGLFRLFGFSALFLPPVLLAIYLLTQFPCPAEPLHVYPSLASLPRSNRVWSIYNETYYPGGEYVSFPHGRMRYWLLGPQKGKKIVLVPGLSIPAIIWRNVAPKLASRGFRVLLYDIYGRGYSDAPATIYDAKLYTTQLALLMQYLNWPKAHIAGVSMGGAIGTAFYDQFPYLVDEKVALLAPAGTMETSELSRTTKLLSSPLGQAVSSTYPVRAYLRSLADSNFTDSIEELVRIQSGYLPGFNRALASSLRQGPIRDQHSSFKALGKSNKQVLIVYGTADKTIPYRSTAEIISLIPRARILTIDGGGHDLTLEEEDGRSKRVTDALLDFFLA